MTIKRAVTATLLASCFVYFCAAEDGLDLRSGQQPNLATGKSATVQPASTAAAATTTTVNSEVFKSVVVAAGQTVSLDSTQDYSALSSVAVTLECAVCTSATTALGSSGLILQARWLVPTADLYAATEMKAATTFLYWDAGAALFNVYGSQFRLTFQNKGSQTITLAQVTIFGRH